MARPQEFDEEKVINDAMNLFWKKGFYNTTLADLEFATGLKRGSIYNSFGSIEKFYLKALKMYLASNADEAKLYINNGKSGLENLRTYIENIAE